MSYENLQNAVAAVNGVERELEALTAKYEMALRRIEESRVAIEQAKAQRQQAVDSYITDASDKAAIADAQREEAQAVEIHEGAERVAAETLRDINRMQRQLSAAVQQRGEAQRRYYQNEMHNGLETLFADRKTGAAFSRVVAAASLAGADLGQVLGDMLKHDQRVSERVATERERLQAA